VGTIKALVVELLHVLALAQMGDNANVKDKQPLNKSCFNHLF
jgi:hypothetical protein